MSIGCPIAPADDRWRSTTLGEVIELKRGYDLPSRDRRDGPYPIVSSSGVSGHHVEAMAKAPGVVTGRYGTLGEVFFIETDYWPLNTSLYVRDFKGNDPRFISYFLKTLDFLAYSDKAAVPGLNRNHLHGAPVVVPPLPEQRAIAGVLGALDDKIEVNRKMARVQEGIARAVFTSWFVNFDPVRRAAAGQPTGLAADLAALFPKRLVDSSVGEVPEGWRASTLGEVIEIHDSKRIPLSGQERAARKGPFRYYGAAGIVDHVDAYLFDGTYLLLGEDGSVVDDAGRPVVQYVWGQFWVNNHAHVLSGTQGFSIEQLYLLAQGLHVKPFVTGAVQPKISQGNLKAIPIILAPEPVNIAFGKAVAPLFARLKAADDQSTTLAAFRDALLPKLISGELRIADVEKIVGRAV